MSNGWGGLAPPSCQLGDPGTPEFHIWACLSLETELSLLLVVKLTWWQLWIMGALLSSCPYSLQHLCSALEKTSWKPKICPFRSAYNHFLFLSMLTLQFTLLASFLQRRKHPERQSLISGRNIMSLFLHHPYSMLSIREVQGAVFHVSFKTLILN